MKISKIILLILIGGLLNSHMELCAPSGNEELSLFQRQIIKEQEELSRKLENLRILKEEKDKKEGGYSFGKR